MRIRVKRVIPLLAALLFIALRSAGASEAVAEAQPIDVLDPSSFFDSKLVDRSIAFQDPAMAYIQGIRVDLPIPASYEMTSKTIPGVDGNPVNFFYFSRDGVMLLECSFKLRTLLDADGEPFRSDKQKTADALAENLCLRETAENTGDAEKLSGTPLYSLVQNNAKSILVEARLPAYDPAAPKGTFAALYEGYVNLHNSSVPAAALAHKNTSGIDTGALYVTWLNRLLETNKR